MGMIGLLQFSLSETAYEAGVEAVQNRLAEHLEQYLEIDRLLSLAAPVHSRF